MIYNIKVKPRSKKPGVEQGADGELIVRVSAPPVDGKANEEVIEQLAAYFSVPRRSVTIRAGQSGRNKIVEIDR